MLDDLQIDLLCRQLNLPETGRQLVRRVSSGESRSRSRLPQVPIL